MGALSEVTQRGTLVPEQVVAIGESIKSEALFRAQDDVGITKLRENLPGEDLDAPPLPRWSS